jgi:putative membrane protein
MQDRSSGWCANTCKLEVLTGDTFDKAYIKNQVSAHERTVSLFKKEIASGTDAQAKAFAKETLPTVQAHLRKIRPIAAQAGVKTR